METFILFSYSRGMMEVVHTLFRKCNGIDDLMFNENL